MKDQPRLYQLNGRIGVTYAGRCDLVAKVDNKLYVVDFKTGSKPKKEPYPEWRFQTAAYRKALEHDSLQPRKIEGNAVLHLDKISGLPTWYDFSKTYYDDLTAFMHLMAFYRIQLKDKFDPTRETPSVTSACSVLDKSGPLMWWATDCMRLYLISELLKVGSPATLIPTSSMLDLINEAQKNYRKVSKEAADIGSQVHSCIEGFLRTGVEPKIEDDRILAGFVAFLEWKDTVKLEVIAQEVVVYG